MSVHIFFSLLVIYITFNLLQLHQLQTRSTTTKPESKFDHVRGAWLQLLDRGMIAWLNN